MHLTDEYANYATDEHAFNSEVRLTSGLYGMSIESEEEEKINTTPHHSAIHAQ